MCARVGTGLGSDLGLGCLTGRGVWDLPRIAATCFTTGSWMRSGACATRSGFVSTAKTAAPLPGGGPPPPGELLDAKTGGCDGGRFGIM